MYNTSKKRAQNAVFALLYFIPDSYRAIYDIIENLEFLPSALL